MSRFLVTGGAGFIGAHLCRGLIARGADVRVLDDLSSGRAGALPAEAELSVGTVFDREVVERSLHDVDGVVHLAAIASVPKCQDDPFGSHTVNQSGFVHILNAARGRLAGDRPLRIVYASSAAVYGNASAAQSIDEDTPKQPLSNYGVDKYAMELHAAAAAAMWGVGSIALRFFNVYGPGQDPSSPYSGVISRFVADITSRGAGTIFGDGQQSRDFIHVNDVVSGIIAALDVNTFGASSYNLCTGRECTIAELHSLLSELYGRESKPISAPARAGEVRRSVGNGSAAKRDLGFTPQIELKDGLRDLVSSSR